MIANFVQIGNPTPSYDPLLQEIQWKPNSEWDHEMYQLDIKSDLKLVSNPHAETMGFWSKLFEKRGHPPYSTF